jgi:hypothetical protein
MSDSQAASLGYISKRLQELAKEAEDLVTRRGNYERAIGDINNRLTQIVGICNELDVMNATLVKGASEVVPVPAAPVTPPQGE